jgi:outer membrane protein assembly factor BamB
VPIWVYTLLFATAGVLLGFGLDYIHAEAADHPEEIHHTVTDAPPEIPVIRDSVDVVLGTFLGDERRAWYGDSLPDNLTVLWKTRIGKGLTYVKGDSAEEWVGAGWTGQPLVVAVNGHPWVLQGSFDHSLRKVDGLTGTVDWYYCFDDILKGTGTIWVNPVPDKPENRVVVMQGSRLGNGNWLSSDTVCSYRAVSFFTGQELWRMNVERGPSFSRDVDGSALMVGNTAFIGLENGTFRKFDPDPQACLKNGECRYPIALSDHAMYRNGDAAKHGGELVVESSPARIGDRIYITAGSGHVFGYSMQRDTVEWDLYLGCDLDGSPVVTADSCLLVTLEKQFIAGRGGVMKIDPRKDPEDAIVWFFPTGNRKLATWHGGIIGTAATNDYVSGKGGLVAVCALDGYTYVLDHSVLAGSDTGFDNKTVIAKPKLVFRYKTGPGISTPIFAGNRLLVACYSGLFLFEYDSNREFRLLDERPGVFESSPVCWQGRIYLASRDGYLYCFGGDGDVVDGAPADAQ